MHPENIWSRAARLVLVLLILLIAITPVTQSIWSGDNFLQGNDDTEYSLALGLTFVSLFLLLCRSKQGDIKEFLCRLKGGCLFSFCAHCGMKVARSILDCCIQR
jgi:hypothetical protein